MVMMFDFYSLCAKYWGESRSEAKARVIQLVVDSGGIDLVNIEKLEEWRYVSYTQPSVMQALPMDARFEMLAHYGICLGEN
jgi:hypothetical protein